MKNILIVDGQGGGLGKILAENIISEFPEACITAVGLNSIATSNMIKAGVKNAATGENPIVVNSRKSDVIIGPIGIVIADSLLGEVTPVIASAIGKSDAVKILIPSSKCNNIVAGVNTSNVTELVRDAMSKLHDILQ